MAMLFHCVKVSLFFLSFNVFVSAQTSADLRAKYGTPAEIFEITPNVSMTVDYAEDGQVCHILIVEKYKSVEKTAGKPLGATAMKIINDIMPDSHRGRKIDPFSHGNAGNCFSVSNEFYEKVEISRHEGVCGLQTGERSYQASILLRQRRCKNERPQPNNVLKLTPR
jgi:hypothetical protein